MTVKKFYVHELIEPGADDRTSAPISSYVYLEADYDALRAELAAERAAHSHVDIEKEVLRRVALITKGQEEEITKLRANLVATDFRASVAEWAVAGVMNLNVRFQVSPEELGDSRRLVEMSRHFAHTAAAMMLERAQLHFRQHSELWELKASAGLHVVYRDPMSTTIPPKESWPRPFAEAKK